MMMMNVMCSVPGQWGVPTVSVAGVLGMLAGVLACTVESISYYPTTARMCGKSTMNMVKPFPLLAYMRSSHNI